MSILHKKPNKIRIRQLHILLYVQMYSHIMLSNPIEGLLKL